MLNTFTSITLNTYHLQNKRLDLWQFDLKSKLTFEELITLSDDEHQRAQRFYFEHHRQRFLNARFKLRQLLAYYTDIPAQKIIFDYHDKGKPYIANHPIEFNLSHSKDLALVAISTYPVGVDLEFYAARPFLGIAKNLFSKQENEILGALPNPLKPLCFFHIWAQKEAIIKATGAGLSYPTETIDVPILPPTTNWQLKTDPTQIWQIQSFFPNIACCGAVCYHPNITEIRYGYL